MIISDPPSHDVKPGPHVCLVLQDDGDGIPAEILDKVFDPFFTTKDVGKGSGLGLSMAKGFTEQSNGWLSIESEPDEGTSVKLLLPANPVNLTESG
jgi:signal transduction histidine kinase